MVLTISSLISCNWFWLMREWKLAKSQQVVTNGKEFSTIPFQMEKEDYH